VSVLVDVALTGALVEWLAVSILAVVVDAAFAKIERDAGGGALKVCFRWVHRRMG